MQSTQIVIGLIGLKGAGKDTAAAALAHKQYVRVAFADKLYQEVADSYGVTVEFLGRREFKERPLLKLQLKRCSDARFREVALQEVAKEQGRRFSRVRLDHKWVNRELRKFRSPRWILQKWGTEYRRRHDDDAYWLKKVQAAVKAQPEANFVITDVRFGNEARFVTDMGGMLARIRRPSMEALEAANRAANGTAAHPSETELMSWPVDHTFFNEEGRADAFTTAVLAAFP